MKKKQIERRSVRRQPGAVVRIACDICVVGSGAAGISAALEAARLGRKVALVDAQPALGGQAVNSLIGTFCGLYSNGPAPYQVTYGIASEILRDLGAANALRPRLGRNTLIQLYDEVALARWIETAVQAAGITVLLGAVLRAVRRDARRVAALEVATRYGDVEIVANGYVDASGDAVLSWLAGLETQEADRPIYGSAMFTIEQVDEQAVAALDRAAVTERARLTSERYGLHRHDGFVFAFADRGVALVNMSHLATPLDPVGMSQAVMEGRAQADRILEFLRGEFPHAFAKARVRTYGLPGIRQTRTIKGRKTLTAEDVRGGTPLADAVARCSWAIELHDEVTASHWEIFGDDHMHYVPLGCMSVDETDNLVAAGRCIDADPVALSSVRVMGPCIAMGAAAAHALDLAGAGSVHQIDIAALRGRIADNLRRRDPASVG